jgi:ApbE superfamily uncharacterized protein (UPF0280 family)
MSGPVSRWLSRGERLHLQHGPIDLIVSADGGPDARRVAYGAAMQRFETVLTELVDELPALRSPFTSRFFDCTGSIARRMAAAVGPHAESAFVTPMAAVAGAVADEMLAVMTAAAPLERAFVNNGGDIAIHLTPGRRFDLSIARLDGRGEHGRIRVVADDPVRGVATSGRDGRSLSMGIADSVTVLAATAAAADAAATLIANAVDLPGHPSVDRTPACEVDPDSDLGDRPVTVGCGLLRPTEIDSALEQGVAEARRMRMAGWIEAAALVLKDESRTVGSLGARWGPPDLEARVIANA